MKKNATIQLALTVALVFQTTQAMETQNNILSLPDDVQGIFISLGQGHLNNISLVCTKWKSISDNVTFYCIFRDQIPISYTDASYVNYERLDFKLINNYKCYVGNKIDGNDSIKTRFPKLKLFSLSSYNFSCKHNYPINDLILRQIPNIQNLGLSKNDQVTNDTLSLLTNITKLDLTGNKIIKSNTLKNLTNITELNISYNHNFGRFDDLLDLVKLKSLDISCTNPFSLNCLKKLTGLTELSLNHTHQNFNVVIMKLTNLTSLSLIVNSVVTDEVLLSLPKLSLLVLTENTTITNTTVDKLSEYVNIIR